MFRCADVQCAEKGQSTYRETQRWCRWRCRCRCSRYRCRGAGVGVDVGVGVGAALYVEMCRCAAGIEL